MMDSAYLVLGIVGLGAVTVLTRAFFLIPERRLSLPPWAREGLRYAPLAALVAAIAPEIVLRDGALVASWQDARLFAVLAGSAYFYVRRGILGTIVSGTAVLLALKLGLGW